MRRTSLVAAAAAAAALAASARPASAGRFEHFTVSTYLMQPTVQQMMDGRLDPADSFAYIDARLKLDKLYIETMRNRTLVDEPKLEKLAAFYRSKGLTVCGGLAYSVSERNGYQGFDYADPADRAFVKRAAEMAARHFDEILLDDYFFFDRKTDADIKAKGDRTWTQYRLAAMRDAAENLVVRPAKAVNPKCRVVIKFANWYDQWSAFGNDTARTPLIADAMYCGTESRTWVGQEQRMQPYQSYTIMRYMDALRPGCAQGGWVDLGGSTPLDRYAEELSDTVFAKRPEITCFEYTAMLGGLRRNQLADRPWAELPTNLNLAAIMRANPDPGIAGVANDTLRQADSFLGQLGKPTGIACYSPHQPTSEFNGEEFVHDYLGMIGLPCDITPTFPTDAAMVLLAEPAAADAGIVVKIKGQLMAGRNVCVTSGLLRKLKGRGIEDVCEVAVTGNQVPVRSFVGAGGPGAALRDGGDNAAVRDVLIPEVHYYNILTHDAWGDLLGVSPAGTTYPIVLSCDYARGKLYVLTIPTDPADLYALPAGALATLRAAVARSEPIRLDAAPAQVGLFRYDNDTAIVQNYLPTPATVTVSVDGAATAVHDLLRGTDTPAEGPRPPAGRRRAATQFATVGGYQPTTRPSTAPAFAAPLGTGPRRTTFTFTVLPHSYVPLAVRR